jgi:hypothetical protein
VAVPAAAIVLGLALLAGCKISRLERLAVDDAATPGDGLSPIDAAPGACGAGLAPCGSSCCAAGEACQQGTCCGAISYQADIQPWFSLRCSACHSWTAPMLTQLAPSKDKCGPIGAGANYRSTWRLVAPGDLANSVAWWFVQNCCAPECGAACGGACLAPPCSSALPRCGRDDPLCSPAHRSTADERKRLQCWILEGAPNN